MSLSLSNIYPTIPIALLGVSIATLFTFRKLLSEGKHQQQGLLIPKFGFIPKTVLITGAGSGLGKATTLALLNAGHAVVGADIDVHALLRLEKEAKTRPGHLVTLVLNVANPDSVRDAAARLKRFANEPQCLNAIINFAGVLRGGPLVEMEDGDFGASLQINVMGTFLVNKYFFPLLKRFNNHDRARIINTASEVSWAGVGAAFNAPYGLTKMAVEIYSTALRQELNFLKPPVDVIVLNPGAFITEMTDHGIDAFQKAANKEGTLFRNQLIKGERVANDVIQRNKQPAIFLANALVKIIQDSHPPKRLVINLSWEMFLAWLTPQFMLDFALPIVMR